MTSAKVTACEHAKVVSCYWILLRTSLNSNFQTNAISIISNTFSFLTGSYGFSYPANHMPAARYGITVRSEPTPPK